MVNIPKKQFFNIKINIATTARVLSDLDLVFQKDQTKVLLFINAHCFNVAQNDSEYKRAIDQADYVLNDGIGMKLGSYLTKVRFEENLNGTDLIPRIISLAAEKNKGVYFIGSRHGIAESAAKNALLLNPNLKISGYHSGFFTREEEKALVEEINNSGASVLLVGMGVPRQEIWVERNKRNMQNLQLIISGGAILDFLSGQITRAPNWMRKTGFEWLYRLYLEPGRMWRRYLIGNFLFFINIIRLKLKFH